MKVYNNQRALLKVMKFKRIFANHFISALRLLFTDGIWRGDNHTVLATARAFPRTEMKKSQYYIRL